MEVKSLSVPGCFLLTPVPERDVRGSFVKTVHAPMFAQYGLQYYSVSHCNVLRGMHFQTPPHDHEKLVYCLAGRALDVILDLRNGSPWFGRAVSVVLDASDPAGIYVARGCAHGFLSLVSDTILLYHVTAEYLQESDHGVRWDTIPLNWPVKSPTTSDRDRSFPKLGEFVSPFQYTK